MNPLSTFVLILFPLAVLLSMVTAQERAPHGINNESPVTLSPSAYDFFHPNMQQPTSTTDPCANLSCSPLPLAAQVEAAKAQERTESTSRVGAGGIVAIVVGLCFAVLLAMGVYYVTVTRQNNMGRASSVQQDGKSLQLV